MATAELTPLGLTVKRLEEIRDDLADATQASPAWGIDTDVGPASPVGQIIDTFAVSVSQLYDLLQEIYDSNAPDTAEGVQLDNVSSISGITREPASFSTIKTLEWSGTPTTVIPAGTIGGVGATGPQFASNDEVIIGGGGTVTVAATATVTGPLEAAINAVDTVITGVPGLSGVDNLTAAVLGKDVETDVELRIRREGSFAIGGHATDQSLRARLEQVDEVQAAAVKSNRTLVTDSDGIPGKAFRASIWPTGLSTEKKEEIALLIFNEQPAGIFADGVEQFNIVDDQGYSQPVAFSFATGLDIWVDVFVTIAAGFPGAAAVDSAILAYGNTLSIGGDVSPTDLSCQIVDDVAGIANLVVKVGFAPSPTIIVPLPISILEIALFDTARNNVTVFV